MADTPKETNESNVAVLTPEDPGEPTGIQKVHDSIQAVRDRVEAGESIMDIAQKQLDAEDTAEETPSADPPEEAGEAEAPKVEEAPAAEAEAGEETPPAQVEEPEEKPEAPKAEEAEGEPEAFMVKVHNPRAGQPDIEIPMLDLSEAEQQALNAQYNGFMRKDEYDKAVITVRDQQAKIRETVYEVVEDTVGFVENNLDPDMRLELVQNVLLDDAVRASVVEMLEEWEGDPSAIKTKALELQLSKRERADKLKELKVQLAQVNRNRDEIFGALDAMMPADITEGDRREFLTTAVGSIQKHVTTNNLGYVPPDAIPGLMQQLHPRMMAAFNVGSAAPPTVAPPVPTDPVKQRAVATEAAATLKAKASRKRSAAATTPGGAGPAPIQTKPPKFEKDQVKKTIAWMKQKVKEGRRIADL